MEILDRRRIEALSMIWSRLRFVWYYLRRGQFRKAFVYLWVSAFTRDAGLGLADWIFRINPFWALYPETIEVEVTTRCHLRCRICEHTYWKEPARDMSFEEFRRVIDQFPKLKWMGLTGIGSSFINKDFLAMLRYAKKRSIFLEFFDTFDLIDARTADELITIGVDKIWVSMEAATKQTYESVRVGARFEKTLANVRYLLDAKKRMKSPLPELWFHYIMNSMNTAEMPQFVDLVKDIVGDNPTCYTTLIYFTSLLHFKEVETLIPVLTPEIQREVAQRARRYNIRLNWNENVESNKPICDCTKWVEPFVLATGHVQPCCAINMANDREFQKQHSWGNLFHEHFRDVWNSDKVRLFKKQIHAGERPVVCKNCRIYKV